MAIDDLLDEHEQSERVRTWLRDNAGGLVGGQVMRVIWKRNLRTLKHVVESR